MLNRRHDANSSEFRVPRSEIPAPLSRRALLARSALGLGGVALAWLLNHEGHAAAPHIPRAKPKLDLSPKPAHYEPKAKAMISLFQNGGPSHVDLFEPKPVLSAHDGQDYPGEVTYSFVNRASKKLFGTPFKFQPHGQSGTELSELLPCLGAIADDICLVRSMSTGINGHEVCIRYLNNGKPGALGRPALGSWLTYGLGTESQDLPAYVVMTDPGGLPVDGVSNWSQGWMPPLYQGTVVRPTEPRILNLDPPPHLRGALQADNLDLLARLNRQHLDRHPGEDDLDARIASFELAARMQTAAKEALDISGETAATHRMYGLDNDETREYGTRCLIARRLVERGVRFVQLFLAGQPWDNHSDIRNQLPGITRRTDRPAAALVTDLKQRGMLDSTVVHFGGEIGRLPVTEGDNGRDHNGQGFSMWLAGGGFKPGCAHGATDEFGHRAEVDIVTPTDYQATLLHLFGLDHQELLFQRNGQDEKLTDGRPCRIVREILA
jgi:hypothetical protein